MIINDKCTHETIRTIYEATADKIVTETTERDLARYFEQSESNVRNVISRNYKDEKAKPKRAVIYNFSWFLKVMPKKWRTKHQ
jgi:hypothetical protein